jgi:hypothetical protein
MSRLSVNVVRAAQALSLIRKEALTQRSDFRGILRKFNQLSVDGIAAQIRVGIEQGEIRQDVDNLG